MRVEKLAWNSTLKKKKTKVVAFGPITSWQIEGEKWKQWQILFCGAPKSPQMVTAAMELKDTCSLEGKLWQTFWWGGVLSLSHVWLCNPMRHSIPGFHSLPKFAVVVELVMLFNQPLLFPPLLLLPSTFSIIRICSMSQFFTSGGQNTGVSVSSGLPMNIQGWFPLRWTGLISLQSKGLSRVFFRTTVQKHQFFGSQPSLWSNSHIHT